MILRMGLEAVLGPIHAKDVLYGHVLPTVMVLPSAPLGSLRWHDGEYDDLMRTLMRIGIMNFIKQPGVGPDSTW